MKKILWILACWTVWVTIAHAQQPSGLTLSDIIHQAQSLSTRFRLAQTQKEISHYQFLTYKSDLNPQISLYGNAPVYNKEYYAVRQPDGTIKFQSINQLNNNIGFSLSQQVPLTGGVLSLNTDLTRFDDFRSKTKQYSGTPVFLQLSQPLFAFNELKWRKKIEPLKLEESKKVYSQEMENIARDATRLYFDVLDAQNDMQIAEVNLTNSRRNYETEQKRIDLGTTTEDKLLQLELQMLRSSQDLEKARYNYQVAQLALKSFVGIKGNDELLLVAPEEIPYLRISITDAFDWAKKNRPEFIAFKRKMEEAQRDVAQARAAKQQVNLLASYGLNNAGNTIGNVYQNPNNQQRFIVGFNIPIVDWGRRKARYNTAKAIEKLTETTNEMDESTIYQEITTLVKNVDLLKANIGLARKTDSVAHRRYLIANNLFQIGKLSVTDLNLAQSEKDNARRDYIDALRSYWDVYYAIRRVTLYDFEKNKGLLAADEPR
ncbi:TolC family protein [Paraflavitalea sp. CAU 1676]|uniref:TolC family protein n=1 Tax=Paraflavitalea sp. CAU 1676 TaxID=3032598 RepID=UPI0023D99B26|nr:TolC family protein [Paraflavitalea sp. CAU 1676]MDF2191998.1 TolC family protein [Paraflavitalea sp. CAU 1676]